ncbi:MAG: 5'/3'-nucleotidase SurE [candidate division Zixibacteria bacterium]|nr:5'/3'-nucleotidase SurE [candidate division Zixibacteria bacterium]
MSEKKKTILITNDDGYFSDGINCLYRELSRIARVYMVAPDQEQSASSHSLTLNRPLRVHKIDKNCYITDGTPTDCIMLAVHLLFKKKRPDMIISGINHGSNMGDDVTYSGTVAAAIEGSILGIPSVAASMANYEPGTKLDQAAKFIAKFVKIYDKLKIDPATFININFPLNGGRPYTKYEITTLGMRQYKDIIVHKTDPRGKAYYWIGGRAKWKTTRGSDFEAIQRKVVSITPLRLNFTDFVSMEELRKIKFKF